MKEHGDAALVEDCLRGDGDALVVLLERYEKPIYNAAFRMLRNPDDARDVTQTVCLKAMENLASYDPNYKFYSWVYRIAINESLNWIKRRDRGSGESADEIPSAAPGPAMAVDRLEVSDHLQAALAELPPGDRAVIVMKYFLECSYDDIGEILEIPSKTVKSRLFTARHRLRDLLVERGLLSSAVLSSERGR